MYKDILPQIDHVAIWPVISFVIFFLFFIVLLWWVFTADKEFIKEMSQKPLHDGSAESPDVESINPPSR
jgi:cytochrome c oxidase cbb3-type subunit IV